MKKTKPELALQLRQEEKQWQHQGTTLLTAQLELPDTESAGAAARRFRRYYQLFSRSFFRYCQHQLLPQAQALQQQKRGETGIFIPAAATLETEITLQQDGILSLRILLTENSSGRPTQLCRGDCWDLRWGLPLSLEDFFPTATGLRRRLLEEVRSQLRRRMEQQPNHWRPDAARRCRRFFNRENFYLSPRGLHLFYPMFALAGAGIGTPDFLVPWSEEGPRLPPQEGQNAKKITRDKPGDL